MLSAKGSSDVIELICLQCNFSVLTEAYAFHCYQGTVRRYVSSLGAESRIGY